MLVKNNAARVHQIGGKTLIQLLPGVNVVDPKAWAEAAKILTIQHYLDIEELEVIDETANTLKEKTAKEAIKIAGDTLDLRLLNMWAEDETRAGVSKALQAQIDLVNAAGDVPEKE